MKFISSLNFRLTTDIHIFHSDLNWKAYTNKDFWHTRIFFFHRRWFGFDFLWQLTTSRVQLRRPAKLTCFSVGVSLSQFISREWTLTIFLIPSSCEEASHASYNTRYSSFSAVEWRYTRYPFFPLFFLPLRRSVTILFERWHRRKTRLPVTRMPVFRCSTKGKIYRRHYYILIALMDKTELYSTTWPRTVTINTKKVATEIFTTV